MSGSRSLELIWKLTFQASARDSRDPVCGDPGACHSKSCDLTEHGDACNDALCFLVVSVLRAARQRGPFTQVRSDSPVAAHCHIILLCRRLVLKTNRDGKLPLFALSLWEWCCNMNGATISGNVTS